MNKFKPGDKIRCIASDFSGGFTPGDMYEVSEVLTDPSSGLPWVRTLKDSQGHPNGWAERNFELIPDFSQNCAEYKQMIEYNSPRVTRRKCSCDFAVIWREGCKCEGV